MRSALLRATQFWDADRSGCDETDMARVVLEHLMRLDPAAVRNLGVSNIDEVAAAAANVLERYAFETADAYAPSARDSQLRRYAATFGLSFSPRLEAERWQTDNQIMSAIERSVSDKPSRIIVCSVEPTTSFLEGLASSRRKLARRKIRLSWLNVDATAGLPELDTPLQVMVNDSIRLQYEGTKYRTSVKLRRAGIGVEPIPILRSRSYREESP